MTNYDILKEYEAHKTPVPSYEEWGELHKRLKDTQNLELEVRRENQQLKELLKECREIFSRTAYTHKFDMVAKIDNVIGER